MISLIDAMKALFYCFVFLLLAFSQVFANECDNALLEFNQGTESILSKRMITYDDVKNFSQKFSLLKSQVANLLCGSEAIAQTFENRQSLKEKRIETINKFIKLKILEEAGTNIVLEYDYLTGKSKKNKYDFEDVFNNSTGKLPEPTRRYEDVNVKAKTGVVVVKPFESKKCSDVIVENEAVNLQNVRNQDSVGWCYAYTAADLLSFKLNKKISAVSLYNSAVGQDIEVDIKNKESSSGGDIAHSISTYLAKNGGLCLEEDLPSNDFKFCTNKRYNDFLNNIISIAREKRLDSELDSSQCLKSDLEAAFPGINISAIRNQVNKTGSKKLIEFLYQQQCKKLSFPGIKINPVTNTIERSSADTLLANIDEQLSKKSLSAIGYDYNKINAETGEGGHGSLVVGRRTNPETGACEYLLRNSWGKNCEQKEGEGLSCHKNCDANGCRYSGHFWVSDERLKSAISRVTYLP